jgi:hypothetical protein
MLTKKILSTAAILMLLACSPQFDWREVRGNDAPFRVLMPAKPASFSRDMQLAGLTLNMQMTAADAAGVNFAVGSVRLDDPGKAGVVAEAMKDGMLKNIQGRSRKRPAAPTVSLKCREITRWRSSHYGRPLHHTRTTVYQVIAIGPAKKLKQDVIDTYMSSFKTD